MPQIYLFATMLGPGMVTEDIRYLHSSRPTKEEADEFCKHLNRMCVAVNYRVVEE